MSDVAGFSLNRPTAAGIFNRKYGGLAPISPYIQSTSPLVQRALRNYDAARANQGQSPLTNAQTRQAGKALGTLNVTPGALPFLPTAVHADAATPAPDRPWWQDAISDAHNVLTSVGHIPFALANEVAAIRSPEAWDAALSKESSNPLEAVGNLAQAPGLRLIPGAFTLSQFGQGGQGVGGLTEHPLLTALDVLPYASKAASFTKTAAAAEDVANRAADVAGLLPRRTTPINSVIRYGRLSGGPQEITRRYWAGPYADTGVEVPALRPNIVGQGLERLQAGLMSPNNPVGKVVAPAIGATTREAVRLKNRASAGMEHLTVNPEADVLGLTTDVTNPFINPDIVRAGARTAHNAIDLMNEFDDIPKARRVDIMDGLEGGRYQMDQFTPHEQDFINTYADIKDAHLRDVAIASGNSMEVPYAGGSEIYDTPTGMRIMAARKREDTFAAAQNLVETLNPKSAHFMTPSELHADFTRAMADPSITGATRTALARGYTSALFAHGVDVGPAMEALRRSANKATVEQLPGLIDPTNITPVIHTLESLTETLKPLADKSFPVNRFVTAMGRDDYATAVREVPKMRENRQVNDILTANNIDLSTDLNRARDIRREVNLARRHLEAAGFNESRFVKASRIRDQLERRSAPGRFQVALMNEAIPRMQDVVRGKAAELGPEVTARTLDQLSSRLFKDAYDTVPELIDVQREVRNSWQELKAQGVNPMFVHHTAPSKLPAAAYPQVVDHITHPQQFKSRLWDAGPTYQDLGVALTHQGMEILLEAGNRLYLEGSLPKAFARDYGELRAELLPEAMRLAEKNPEKNVAAHLDDLVDKAGFQHFDPEAFITGRTPPPGAPVEGTMMIPKEIAKALQQMRATPGVLGQLAEGPMKIFRTSVLPLSPRWHVNNILGGSITTMARAENPLTMMRHLPQAIRMARAGGPESILNNPDLPIEARKMAELMAPGGNLRQDMEWFRSRSAGKGTERLDMLNKFLVGRTMRRLLDQAQESRVVRAAQGFVQKSYNFNQAVDDMYRSLAYFEGSERALKKGMSQAESIRAGVKASRDMLQNWDTLTPMERGVIRSIFPFYSWARFMLKYVMTYPGDHPWRTSIMANLSRTEANDYGSGIPQDLRSLLFFGDMDKNGNLGGVNTDSFNPFRDTANYFSLVGFLSGGQGDVSAITSQVNPGISTLLQWAGVDPSTGMTDLYPELQYDPQTGRMVAVAKQNPILGAIGNIVPQVNAVTAFAGINNQYRDLMARDPAAARRYLMSTVGVPVLHRDVNLFNKVIGGEVTRYNALKTDLNNGLRAGDLSGFQSRYPTLNALSSRLNTLMQTPEFAAQYGRRPNLPGTYQMPGGLDRLKDLVTHPVG